MGGRLSCAFVGEENGAINAMVSMVAGAILAQSIKDCPYTKRAMRLQKAIKHPNMFVFISKAAVLAGGIRGIG
jgi:hypothetical protein